MKLGWEPRKWLKKKAKRGIQGYPVGTIAYYGPDNRRASKAAVGIIPAPKPATCGRTRRPSPRSPGSCASTR
jgi:hypothetical protein